MVSSTGNAVKKLPQELQIVTGKHQNQVENSLLPTISYRKKPWQKAIKNQVNAGNKNFGHKAVVLIIKLHLPIN